MKNDMIQPSNGSIQFKSESFVRRFKLKRVDSYVIRFKELWIDSSIVKDLDESIQCVMNRFNVPKDEQMTTFHKTQVNPKPRHIDDGCFNMLTIRQLLKR